MSLSPVNFNLGYLISEQTTNQESFCVEVPYYLLVSNLFRAGVKYAQEV
jgi:hypothetical protein